MTKVAAKKQKITYQKEKALLSDTLPYETPVTFSNRYFYRFLIDNKIEIQGDYITYNKEVDGIKDILQLLFNVSVTEDNINFSKKQRTIPFTFKISHKKSDYRVLSLIHPLNQLTIVDFYDKYKETIKYYSNQSRFSIRRPYKISKNRYVNDYLFKLKANNKKRDGNLEIHEKGNEHLKSFFTYTKYSNIHHFFESNEYHKCEKKFDFLYKMDVNKCFDSIYTHTIAWAIFNKEIVKDNLDKKIHDTFAGKFDKLIQNMNYGETNGILIGSEVSRIFAELILQKIDFNVQKELEKNKVKHKVHYRVFRYVDDYFLFYDDFETKNSIVDTFKHELKNYNLSINDTKTVEFSKPIITDLTIAKLKITELFDKYFSYNIEQISDVKNSKWTLHLKSQNIITKFKIIIKENGIDYKDVLNYSIAVIEKRFLNIVNKFEIEKEKDLYSKMFVYFIINMLDFLFFIYSVSPRVTSTIKMVSLISKLLFFMKKNKSNNVFKPHEIDSIHKKIHTEVFLILDKNKLKPYTQNETIYLLILLGDLGKEYRLSYEFLDNYFFKEKLKLNYFVIIGLLFYMKNISAYKELKSKLLDNIKNKFETCNKESLRKNTELTLLIMDLITCPYIYEKDKRDLLSKNKITCKENQDNILEFSKKQKFWFTKWQDFNLMEEMEMKKCMEVYA